MNENHASDVKMDETQNGTVSFATDVIATIAGLAAQEIEGVASMNGTSGGFAEMFGKKSQRTVTKGVKIDLVDNAVVADVTMTVEYGFPIPTVAGGIQENVKKAVENMTGLTVSAVNVHVIGISFENEMKAAKALDEQQKKMLEQMEKDDAPAEEEKSEPEQEPAAEAEETEPETVEEEIVEEDPAEDDEAPEEEPSEE